MNEKSHERMQVGVFHPAFLEQAVEARMRRLPEDQQNPAGFVSFLKSLQPVLEQFGAGEAFADCVDSVSEAIEDVAFNTIAASAIGSFLRENFTLPQAEALLNQLRDDFPEDPNLRLNEAFFVTIDSNESEILDMHVLAMMSKSWNEKLDLQRSAFAVLAHKLANETMFAAIATVRLRSWLVAKNPAFFTQMGFSIDTENTDIATMDTAAFIDRYQQTSS